MFFFFIVGRRIQFSKSEFAIITDLKMGEIPPLLAMQDTKDSRLMETYFPLREGAKEPMRLRHWFGLVRDLEMRKLEDRDVIAIALYFALERFILGHDRKKFASY